MKKFLSCLLALVLTATIAVLMAGAAGDTPARSASAAVKKSMLGN